MITIQFFQFLLYLLCYCIFWFFFLFFRIFVIYPNRVWYILVFFWFIHLNTRYTRVKYFSWRSVKTLPGPVKVLLSAKTLYRPVIVLLKSCEKKKRVWSLSGIYLYLKKIMPEFIVCFRFTFFSSVLVFPSNSLFFCVSDKQHSLMFLLLSGQRRIFWSGKNFAQGRIFAQRRMYLGSFLIFKRDHARIHCLFSFHFLLVGPCFPFKQPFFAC